MTASENKTALSACESARDTYLDAMQRPFFREWPRLLARVACLAAISMFPLFVAILASVDAPVTQPPAAPPVIPTTLTDDDAPLPGAPETELGLIAFGLALEAARAHLAEAARNVPPHAEADTSLRALKEAVEIRETLHANARSAAAKPAIDAQTDYVDRLRFVMVLLIFLFLSLMTLYAQMGLLWRHWEDFIRTRTSTRLHLGTPLWSTLFVFLAACSVLHVAREDIQRPLFLGDMHGAAYYWAAGAAALVIALAYVTLFATWTYAAHYPSAREAGRILDEFDKAARRIGKKTDYIAVLAKVLEPDPVDPWRDDDTQKKSPPGTGRDFKALLVNTRLTAAACTTVIRALSVALGIVMVLGLIVLNMALDMIPADANWSADFRTSVAASADVWVLAIGFGCSAVLFLTYGLPVARLTPFVSAATRPAAAPVPDPEWTLRGTMFPHRIKLKAVQDIPDQPRGPNADLEDYEMQLGADPAKFLTILKAGNHGGGFQQLMANTLGTQLKAVLGILSPALVGGILSLLG